MPRKKTGKIVRKEDELFHAPKGMHDILPANTPLWEKFRTIAADFAEFYGFGFIETPILEQEGLFSRGLGATTDVVEKEMYTLRTKGGDRFALRPEGTAGVARAYIQHGMNTWPQPVKLWYWGPMFRHDQPQAGRFRQFHHAGFEYFGEEHPAVDVELIQIVAKVLEGFGIARMRIEVNSIGCRQCRPAYKAALKSYYRSRSRRLCPDCRKRLTENPLRLLDCKNETCVLLKRDAPEFIERLCEECHDHFKKVLDFLDDLKYPYLLNPYLVRGLDYYNRTVFEVIPESDRREAETGRNAVDNLPLARYKSREDYAGLAVAGGGRFDYLVDMLGGPSTPAVGAAIGIERAIAAYRSQGGPVILKPQPKVFLVQLGDMAKKQALKIFEELRMANIACAASLGRDSIKAQLKVADRLGVPYALILGQKEAIDANIILRDMQSGAQETIPLEKIVEELRERLKKR